MPLNPLPIVAPVAPNFGKCSSDFGDRLNIAECHSAAAQLPVGNSPTSYRVDGGNVPVDTHAAPLLIGTVGDPYILPWAGVKGNCMIVLEIAGPARPETLTLIPDDIRGMAGWVINNCVGGRGGIGGYITGLLQGLFDLALDPNSNFLELPWPDSTAFITLTISSLIGEEEPGDNRLDVLVALDDVLEQKSYDTRDQTSLRNEYAARWLQMHYRLTEMLDGENGLWWNLPNSPSAMTYECDNTLGAPRAADCNALEYSELGASSDTVSIGPGTPKVLNLNLCDVAISADAPIVLTWEQIRAALDTLINLCVSNPVTLPMGGKAYYSNPVAYKSRRIKKRVDEVSELNALPPHVNLTLYEPGKFNP